MYPAPIVPFKRVSRMVLVIDTKNVMKLNLTSTRSFQAIVLSLLGTFAVQATSLAASFELQGQSKGNATWRF